MYPIEQQKVWEEMQAADLNHKEKTKQPAISLPALMGLDNNAPVQPKRDKFFYASPLIAQRLVMLNHFVNSNNHIVLVIGERGSGKTTLLNRFVADSFNPWQACRVRLKPNGKAASGTWRNLDNRLVFLSKKDSLPWVIIDDVHQLSQGELELLLTLTYSQNGQRRIQGLVLFAESQMRDRIAEIGRQLPPKTTVDKIFMTPFTENQTGQYLVQRFKAAGILEKIPFSKSQIHSIFEESGGLPGSINDSAFILLKKIYQGKSPLKQPILTRLLECMALKTNTATKSLRYSVH
jgi:type II secretory pathway predicted ATPase ExeA